MPNLFSVCVHPSILEPRAEGGGGLIAQKSPGEKAEEHAVAFTPSAPPVKTAKQGSVAFGFDMTAEACVLLLQRVSPLRA